MGNQLELMEKSFQMAAKYLPGGQTSNVSVPVNQTTSVKTIPSKKQSITVIDKTSKEIVSSLVKPMNLQDFFPVNPHLNQTFYTAEGERKAQTHKNSIKVSIKEDQVIINEGYIKLRLLESIVINGALFIDVLTCFDVVQYFNYFGIFYHFIEVFKYTYYHNQTFFIVEKPLSMLFFSK